jgi:serine/threonine protein kinase/formylglycine-generating enzyme required for sulfatase activity
MAGGPDAAPEDPAGSLFASWLAGRRAGSSGSFDEFLRGHPALERELAELHEHWRRLEGRMRALEVGPASTGGAAPPAGLPSSREPAQVLDRLAARGEPASRYRVDGELGRGGMGAVLSVWDEDLDRALAMKVMLETPSGPRDRADSGLREKRLARFLEEAQISARLDHPGVVPVHELGVAAGRRVYFTMKLVEGQTLESVFRELARGIGGWTPTRVLGLILKVCDAVSYAHAKGVLHRDLKPANVMVGRFGEVYVMDWGLAKVIGGADVKDIRLRGGPTPRDDADRRGSADEAADLPLCTLDGDVIGTPAYMPPEQANGRIEEMGPHSDVYAIGAMLYHLLAGHPPFAPPNSGLRDRAVWQRVKDGPPEPLSEVARDAPAELAAICEKAMSRDPRARYAEIAILREDLSAYLEDRVVRAYEIGAWAEARKWVRRNRALAATLATALFLAVGGLLGIGLVQAHGKRVSDQLRMQAQAETAKVLRLSDVKVLQELERQADALWPAYPAQIQPLEAWLVRARALVERLAIHRSTLAEMRAHARSQGPTWRFESPDEQWQHDVLAELIEDLERFEAGLLSEDGTTSDHGWSIPKRLARARRLETSFAPDGEGTRAWTAALPQIRAAYPGLELKPQAGLVPIGPDPESRLWEFVEWTSGALPQRDADGTLTPTEDLGVVLVLLRGGRFWMGAQSTDASGRNFDAAALDNEKPVHEVELSPFFLSKYELTQAQWLRLSGANPSYYHLDALSTTLLHPVERISWIDCRKWLPRMGLDLPSEAQWEYAARAGTSTPWWTGADRESLRTMRAANLADQAAKRAGANWPDIRDWPDLDDGFGIHAPIGATAANPFGLHEVIGNVSEWCADGYWTAYYEKSAAVDPIAPSEGADGRIYRGGSYSSSAARARVSMRQINTPTEGSSVLGVRPARAIER